VIPDADKVDVEDIGPEAHLRVIAREIADLDPQVRCEKPIGRV
jgi:hypothetical protein